MYSPPLLKPLGRLAWGNSRSVTVSGQCGREKRSVASRWVIRCLSTPMIRRLMEPAEGTRAGVCVCACVCVSMLPMWFWSLYQSINQSIRHSSVSKASVTVRSRARVCVRVIVAVFSFWAQARVLLGRRLVLQFCVDHHE